MSKHGRACWFKAYNFALKKHSEWQPGELLAWSTSSFGAEPGEVYPAAIIESKDGSVKVVDAEQVSFASVPQ